uniref:Glucose-1-phosphate thymidylyltransferase n=1 Tax=Thermosporothrix sp. COM3 TaxID=2490863 RepID=A0A455SVM2_9CHLR|nr:nucleotidyltransferase [Thermosporothrix sp. COM3]
MRRTVGVLPAAGLGKRLKPYNGLKELLPVGYYPSEKGPVPMVVSQYVMNALRAARVQDLYFVISPQKWEIARFFTNGSRFGMNCCYLFQDEPEGMPGALDSAYPWVRDSVVCMGMPDTIMQPTHCFAQLLEEHRKKAADLTLGIFPTETPQSLAPVHLEPGTGRVLEIFDKPQTTTYYNTWGVAVWEPSFTELLHHYVSHASRVHGQELLLSNVFLEAIKQNLRVYGTQFEDGTLFDIGTFEGLRYARAILENVEQTYC